MSHRSNNSRKSARGIKNDNLEGHEFQEDATQVRGGFFCCSSANPEQKAQGDGDQGAGCTIF